MHLDPWGVRCPLHRVLLDRHAMLREEAMDTLAIGHAVLFLGPHGQSACDGAASI